jgi:FkbM family methyltransferase
LLKSYLKKLRSSQPFNSLATFGAKTLFPKPPEFLVKHLHRIDLVESKLPNGRILKLNSKGDDWVSNQVFWRGWQGYEPETVPLFYKLAEQSTVMFDVGAYVGFFTLLAAHANPNARVFAFEPMTAIYQRLCQNIELNALQNVNTNFGAVGAEEGEAEFFHQEGTDLPTSSSLSFEFMQASENLVSTKVKVFQLDKFAQENGIEKIDLMKVDTETTEPDVLIGAKNLLKKHQPDIVCEVLAGRAEGQKLKEILVPLGYKFYLLTSEGATEREEIEGHPDFLNYLFTPKTASELVKFYN